MASKNAEKNPRLFQLIKRAHGLLENGDLEKHRQSQDQIGALLGHTKELNYREVDINGVYCEWVTVNRAHIRKQVILHCHGGGYSTGSSLYARTITTKLAMSTGFEVLCFDYRLAPEHPYPAAIEDAIKIWDYLMLLGYGSRDIILTGDSAGGNLALELCLELKKRGRFLPKGLLLMSPWTDLTCSGASYENNAEKDPVLNVEYIHQMIEAYAKEYDVTDWAISPIFGDFTDFPPTYIQVGDCEILLSDSEKLYEKMKEAGVDVQMDVFPGMWHVFQMSPFKTAYDAMNRNAEFIISKLLR